MADETEDTEKPRNKGWDNLKPAQPGEVRNPHGRPKGSRNRATVLNELLATVYKDQNGQTRSRPFGMEGDPLTVEEALDVALVAKGLAGDVSAIREIKDTVYGKPSQLIGQDPENPFPTQLPPLEVKIHVIGTDPKDPA